MTPSPSLMAEARREAAGILVRLFGPGPDAPYGPEVVDWLSLTILMLQAQAWEEGVCEGAALELRDQKPNPYQAPRAEEKR